MIVGTRQIKTTFVNTSNMYMVVGGAREVLFASADESECISFINKCTEDQVDNLGSIKVMAPNEDWIKDSVVMDVEYKTAEEVAEESSEQAKAEKMGVVEYMMAGMEGALDNK